MLRRFCCVLFATFTLVSHAQAPPRSNRVILSVTALDAKGNPVTDLTEADFEVFDEGKRQAIASFRGPATQSATETSQPTTLILFDLLNSAPRQRGYISTVLTHALEPLETADSVYLYLFTNRADLYPVRGLMSRADAKLEDAHWNRMVHGMLDAAIEKVYGLRPVDDKDAGARAANTFQALGELAEQLRLLPGPKTLVWITTGVPNWVHPYVCRDIVLPEGTKTYVAGKCRTDCMKWSDGKCLDYTPFLQHLSRVLDQSGTVIETVESNLVGSVPAADPGSSHDTIEQLANLTGGRIYIAGDAGKAIKQALREAPARYQLSYEAPLPDGKYHKLRVVCVRKGIRIETKRGYYAFADQSGP